MTDRTRLQRLVEPAKSVPLEAPAGDGVGVFVGRTVQEGAVDAEADAETKHVRRARRSR